MLPSIGEQQGAGAAGGRARHLDAAVPLRLNVTVHIVSRRATDRPVRRSPTPSEKSIMRRSVGATLIAVSLLLACADPAPDATRSATPPAPAAPQPAAQAAVPAAESAQPAGGSGEAAAPGARRLILDVRTPEEYAAGHVEGALLIPHDQVAARLAELEPYREGEVVLYCRTGRRAAIVERLLRANGFESVVNAGGLIDMQRRGARICVDC